MERKWKAALLTVMAIALIASLYLIVERMAAERDNQSAAIAIDWLQARDYGKRQGLTEVELLEALQGKANVILFKERLFSEWISDGQVSQYNAGSLRLDVASGQIALKDQNGAEVTAADIAVDAQYYLFSSPAVFDTVVLNLEAKRLGEFDVYTAAAADESLSLLRINFPLSNMSTVGVGFDQRGMELAASYGFEVLPQFRSWPGYAEGDMAALLRPFADFTVSAILFNDNVLPGLDLGAEGVSRAYKDMAAAIDASGAPVASIEFLAQRGLSQLAKASGNHLVRLHVIADNEMSTLTPAKALDRYTLAVNERNIRIVYAKFFSTLDFEGNLALVADLNEALTASGFVISSPSTFGDIGNSALLRFVIGLGVAAGGIALLDLLRLRKLGLVLGAVLVLGVAGLMAVGQEILAAKGLALLASIIFPTLAVFRFAGAPRGVGKALAFFGLITAVTMVGAVYVMGLLGDKVFMLRLDAYSGIKLSLAAPLLLLFFLLVLYKGRENPLDRAIQVYREPVRNGHLFLGLLFCGILLVFLLRSGNDGMSVTGLELAIRTKLDAWLVVRPRTKEFLLGHPALLLALYYGYKDKFLPLWILGAVGQVSIINTFSHIHTPVLVSLLRTVNGVWLGLAIGLLAIGCIHLLRGYLDKNKVKGNDGA